MAKRFIGMGINRSKGSSTSVTGDYLAEFYWGPLY